MYTHNVKECPLLKPIVAVSTESCITETFVMSDIKSHQGHGFCLVISVVPVLTKHPVHLIQVPASVLQERWEKLSVTHIPKLDIC